MKLKEICTETGLSRKTIRLYEEKGLLVPQKEYRNGREYREYSEADARTLKEIAILRRSWFTMEEIRRMQEDPENIREIFPQYRQWLEQQKTQLDGLLAAARSIDPEEITSVGALSAKMETEAGKLALPLMDIDPHFKYLDQLEEVRDMRKEIEKKDYFEERPADTRTFRQVTLSMDKDRVNDLAVPFGQFRDWEAGAWEKQDGPVSREEKEPKWIGLLTALGIAMVAVGFILYVVTNIRDYGRSYSIGEWPWDMKLGAALLVLGIVLSFLVRGLVAYRERQRWLKVVRQQEREKQARRTDK